MSKTSLYLNTIRQLKPVQIISRLRGRRTVSADLDHFSEARSLAISISCLDCDPMYASRFDIDAISKNEFLLINERHRVDCAVWNCFEASHLWNFNLHYFEYCVPLAARYVKQGSIADAVLFKCLVESWIDACQYPKGDAWHPYTISLRLVNWLVCIDLLGDAVQTDSVFMSRANASMYRQYRHLLINQEKHLLANHYFENLKTLVIMAQYFGEKDVLAKAERDLLCQLDEQILPDGVHYERSMMYHKLVLEGLLRVSLAYRSVDMEIPTVVVTKAQQMLDAMESIECGMGKTPFFNDSADGVAKEHSPLAEACKHVFSLDADGSKLTFSDSGFYKLYDRDTAIVFFVGEPGPCFMLGHAHCDLLSFELSIAGKPVFVNSGTYAYQSRFRSYFRSTAAHNTVMAEGKEQMECWGEHRVARGIRDVEITTISRREIVARFTDFHGVVFTRSLKLIPGGLEVCDSALGSANLVSYLKLAPGFSVRINEEITNINCGNDIPLRVESLIIPEVNETYYSSELGFLEITPRLSFAAKGGDSIAYRILWNKQKKEN